MNGSVYLLLLGCSTPETTSTPVPVAAPRAALELTEAEAQAWQQTFIGHLDTGRKAAHVGQFDEALVALQAAQAMSPGSAQLSAEICWAAFKTGEVLLAEAAGLRAVRLAEHRPVTHASSLYLLGRIAEAQAHLPEAARYYARSLRLRPSLHVQAGLDALRRQGVQASLPDPVCGLGVHTGSVDALCAQVSASWAADSRAPAACRMSGDHDGQARRVSLAGGKEAVLFAVHSDGAARYVLAVGRDAAWHHVSLGQAYSPGALGTAGSVQIQLEERALDAAPGAELLVTVSSEQTLLDISVDELDTLAVERTLVIGGLGTEPVLLMDTRTAERYSRERMGLATDEERSVGYLTSGLPIRHAWAVAAAFDGAGAVTLEGGDGSGDAPSPVALGSDALLCRKN